jgi:hypothetical protein
MSEKTVDSANFLLYFTVKRWGSQYRKCKNTGELPEPSLAKMVSVCYDDENKQQEAIP